MEKKIKIAICGCKFSDPEAFVKCFAKKFNTQTSFHQLNDVDKALETQICYNRSQVSLSGVRQTVFFLEYAYYEHLRNCDLIFYLFPISFDFMPMAKDDHAKFSHAYERLPSQPKVLFFYNDYWTGSFNGDIAPKDNFWPLIPENCPFFSSSIGVPFSEVKEGELISTLNKVMHYYLG